MDENKQENHKTIIFHTFISIRNSNSYLEK